MTRMHLFQFTLLFTCGTLFLHCDVDHGLNVDDATESVRQGIRGRITFSGSWPSNIAEARLVATANFPPDPTQPLDAFIFSDPIQVGSSSLDYGLNLKAATYQIIAVILRETGKAWDIGNIQAVFSPLSACTIIPDLANPITIAPGGSIVEGVDIAVDLTKGNIAGQVQFNGLRPQDVQFAGILAFESPLNLLDPIPCGLAILPLDATVANYKVLVPPNKYVVVAVAGMDLTDITNFRIIGAHLQDGSVLPAVVEVGQNQNVSHVDLVANWSGAAN